MADWQDYLKLMRGLSRTLEKLSQVEREKDDAATRGDLAGVEACMKREQVMSLSLRGFDQRRDKLLGELGRQGFRAEVDGRNEKIGKKIREATLEKIPFMLVVGDRDVENGTVSVRRRSGEDLGAMSLEAFAGLVGGECASKAIL